MSPAPSPRLTPRLLAGVHALALLACSPDAPTARPPTVARLVDALPDARLEAPAWDTRGQPLADIRFERLDPAHDLLVDAAWQTEFLGYPVKGPEAGGPGHALVRPGNEPALLLAKGSAYVRLIPLDRPQRVTAELRLAAAKSQRTQLHLIELPVALAPADLADPVALRALVADWRSASIFRPVSDDGPKPVHIVDFQPKTSTRALLLYLGAVDRALSVSRVRVDLQPPLAILARSSDSRLGHPNARHIDVDHDDRESIVLPSPSQLEFELTLPHAAPRLVFSTSTLPGEAGQPVSFEVHARDLEGTRTATLRGTFGAETPRWHDWTLDLGALAGQAVSLSFRFENASRDLERPVGIALGAPSIEARPERPRPDVVLISLDTMRADRMSLYGHPRPTTPSLDALAPDAAVFERAISSATWTLPSHVSVFTGQLPQRHGVQDYRQRLSPTSGPHLAALFRAQGYRTVAFTAGGFVHPDLGFAEGFERYTSTEPLPLTRDDDGLWRPEEAQDLRDLTALLREPDRRPVFVFAHTYAAHIYQATPEDLAAVGAPPEAAANLPYEYATDWPERQMKRARQDGTTKSLTADLRLLYDASMRRADALVDEVRGALREGGRADSAYMIIFSDHGEELYDHGGFGHYANLWQTVVRVPLVMHGPGIQPARHTGVVSLVDIAPTLHELFGLFPSQPVDGRSLVPLLRGGTLPALPAFSQAHGHSAIQDERYKLRLGPGGTPMLFDLQTDPAERKNLSHSQAQLTGRLKGALENRLAELQRVSVAIDNDFELSPERIAELKKLGYLGDG